MTVFLQIYLCKKAVLLQIYISVKKQLSYGTVFLHNIYIFIYNNIYNIIYIDLARAKSEALVNILISKKNKIVQW